MLKEDESLWVARRRTRLERVSEWGSCALERTADVERCADCGELPESGSLRCGNCNDRRDGVVRSSILDVWCAP